jgi:hypothetical protein
MIPVAVDHVATTPVFVIPVLIFARATDTQVPILTTPELVNKGVDSTDANTTPQIISLHWLGSTLLLRLSENDPFSEK